MIRLRSKLWLGFGGLLLILLIVTVTSIVVLNRYSNALHRTFRENYESAVFCNKMKASLDALNAHAQRLAWNAGARSASPEPFIAAFDANLQKQIANVTLPGEAELTNRLAESWDQYKAVYRRVDNAGADSADLYRRDLLGRYEDLERLALRIADTNMANMANLDGDVKRTAGKVRDLLVVLVTAGSALAATFVAWVGASILRSIATLTDSAKRIEAGDLDLQVEVRSRDEIGQLGQAFNSMASRLREFRRLDHHRLVRTQRTTQLAIDSLPDAVCIIGPHGVIEISNRTAQTYFGIIPGASVSDLHLSWLTDTYDTVMSRKTAVEPAEYKTAIQLFENGEERFLLPRAVPMQDEQGAVIGVALILADVTRLRRADELKSGLVSTVSHELRTPLTSIRMGILMLADGTLGPLNARQQQSLDAVSDDSDRLNRIIENLLNMSRIEAGTARFQFTRMTVEEIVAQADEGLRRGFAEKNIRLTTEVPAALPAVMADPSCIGLALTNLLSNALKYTPKGGEVRVTACSANRFVVLSVSDTVPGVPEEYAQRIFEKFFRLPNKDRPPGPGLGLAITREIVEAHSGWVRYRAGEHGGSEFTFGLPGEPPDEEASSRPHGTT